MLRSIDRYPYPCAHAHKLSFLEYAQKKKKNANNYANVHRGDFSKIASNQALPGPSTSVFSSPSESPWEVQPKEKVISLCLERFPQLFAGWCSASKRTLG